MGIASPVRNNVVADGYKYNTFSPVAVANKSGATDAQNATLAETAWKNDNFYDDLDRFFGSGELYTSHGTYYKSSIPNYWGTSNSGMDDCEPAKTIFFGWTWNNVVTSEPTGYDDSDDPNILISSKEGLAWLISLVNGLNDQKKTSLFGKTVKLTADIDNLDQYIWLPIGSEQTSKTEQFAGTFDGQGHLIKTSS